MIAAAQNWRGSRLTLLATFVLGTSVRNQALDLLGERSRS